MDNALATLSDTDNVVGGRHDRVNATDSLGDAAVTKTIGVTVANGPVIGVPTGATVGVGKTGPIAGMSLSELNAPAAETFTLTLADSNGVLTASAAGGGSVTGSGGTSLTIGGTLTQVTAALATLADTDATTPSDTITLNATDQFGNTAAQKTIAVTVNARPAFSAACLRRYRGRPAGVDRQHQSHRKRQHHERDCLVVTVADTHGLLTVGNASGVTLGGNNSTSLTISGAFASVQSALTTLLDTDATTGSDTITLNATDSFGNTANTATEAVTVNGLPVIAAPRTLNLGVGKPGSITGVSLSESGTTTNETFTVTLAEHSVTCRPATPAAPASPTPGRR